MAGASVGASLADSGPSRIAIIGLGLIGGSMALALKNQGKFVAAFDTCAANLESGLALGVIDEAASSIVDATEGAELIIVAVPVLAMAEVFAAICHRFDQADTVISDVGSVKSVVLDAVKAIAGHIPDNFVPAHPIAGSEKHGVSASNADLFKQHKVILTPAENTLLRAIEQIKALWQSFGAEVTTMEAAHHDLVLAQTSHLPHLLAYALIDSLSKQGDSLEVFDYAAGGLRDFSRIAASDPTMWGDIFKSNRVPLLETLDRYLEELTVIRSLIDKGDSEEVLRLLGRAKEARDHFSRILEKRS